MACRAVVAWVSQTYTACRASKSSSVQAGARHAVGATLISYGIALSQAHYTGGFPRAGFDGPGTSDNSVAFGVDTKNPFIPKFSRSQRSEHL